MLSGLRVGLRMELNVVKLPSVVDHALDCFAGISQFVRSFFILPWGIVMRNLNSAVPSMVGYVGGSMQCGLKGICAKCLQWQIDPDIRSPHKGCLCKCSWQDQPLELVDLGHLDQRHHACQAMQHLNQLWQHHQFQAVYRCALLKTMIHFIMMIDSRRSVGDCL